MTAEAERAFDAELVRDYEVLKAEVGYDASRFKQLIDELGGVETARRLLRGHTHSYGLDRLWKTGQLGMSLEASVLKPGFAALFTEDERKVARFRLESYGFDVERFLRELA